MKVDRRTPWVFLAPHLPLFTIFILAPVAAVFALSVFDWNLLGDHRFNGLANYIELFQDRQFWAALTNTLLYAAVIVPITMSLGLALALLLNRGLPGKSVFRAILYLPTAISSVASAMVAAWIFDEQYGFLNALLVASGLPRVPWLSSPRFAMFAVILTTIWLRTGLCMLVYLAALQNVPGDLLAAAELDGAGAWNRFRYIIFPLLRPSTTFLLTTTLIYSLHVFDLIFVMTHGGPAFSTTVLVQYLYDTAYQEQRQGYASAISVVLLLILLVITATTLRGRLFHVSRERA